MTKKGYNTVLFTGKNAYASVSDDEGLYDAGNDKDFTVQMQIKVLTPSPGYVGFLSKGNGYGAGTAVGNVTVNGWTMGTWAKLWKPYYNGGFTGDQGTLADGKWHTLTMTVKRTNATTRTLAAYTDGVAGPTVNIHGKPMSSSNALTIGWRNVDNNTPIDFYASNVAYFETALTVDELKSSLAPSNIQAHPQYSKLIGYWPIDEGTEGYLTNRAPRGYNMTLSSTATWKGIADDTPPGVTIPALENGFSIPSTSSNVGVTMMYWLGISILPDFNMDGSAVLNRFEGEFLPIKK